MKIIANRSRCVGHARCAAAAESLFVLDENGYVSFETVDVPAGLEELARKGVRSCPERALRIEREEAGDGAPTAQGT
ncbi:MAG: ferredoxin [Steroidobacteraceae bacterium]|jgi:ferredoxin